MSFISWNIRGRGSILKKIFVAKLVRKQNLDILFIQESKLRSFERFYAIRLWESSNAEFVISEATRSSGGLLIF